jgi:hypothetical protein
MDNPYDPQRVVGTTSLDLPPALAGLLSMGGTTPAMPRPGTGIDTGMMGPQNFAPSYEAGGMIGQGGMPVPMGMPPAQGAMPQMPAAQGVGVSPQMQSGKPMDFSMLEMQINQFASQHPQQVQQIQQTIMEEMQSGGLTQQELNMMVQLATVAAQNPQMYPQVRQFAIQQGIATEQDLPREYDQGLVFVLLLAGRAAQSMQGGQGVPSMEFGGSVPPSQKNDGSVLINAHEGEYVIPKNVVDMKGKEFFDNLVAKYKGDNNAG